MVGCVKFTVKFFWFVAHLTRTQVVNKREASRRLWVV